MTNYQKEITEAEFAEREKNQARIQEITNEIQRLDGIYDNVEELRNVTKEYYNNLLNSDSFKINDTRWDGNIRETLYNENIKNILDEVELYISGIARVREAIRWKIEDLESERAQLYSGLAWLIEQGDNWVVDFQESRN